MRSRTRLRPAAAPGPFSIPQLRRSSLASALSQPFFLETYELIGENRRATRPLPFLPTQFLWPPGRSWLNDELTARDDSNFSPPRLVPCVVPPIRRLRDKLKAGELTAVEQLWEEGLFLMSQNVEVGHFFWFRKWTKV
ncbi:hypothetical protein KM043_006821 [Ampulex compressa]|nr:hypothetical protein KM043_006821 [Ampulex compressa]